MSRTKERCKARLARHKAKWIDIGLKTLLMPPRVRVEDYLADLGIGKNATNKKALLAAWRHLKSDPRAPAAPLIFDPKMWSNSMLEYLKGAVVLPGKSMISITPFRTTNIKEIDYNDAEIRVGRAIYSLRDDVTSQADDPEVPNTDQPA